mmetsp:Transcript_1584/g.4275  ORF Transcript_1584/g.4275 Transcript_1584/m.4275 type:complete len:224 (+) Transcript_1584:968-1639(+)
MVDKLSCFELLLMRSISSTLSGLWSSDKAYTPSGWRNETRRELEGDDDDDDNPGLDTFVVSLLLSSSGISALSLLDDRTISMVARESPTHATFMSVSPSSSGRRRTRTAVDPSDHFDFAFLSACCMARTIARSSSGSQHPLDCPCCCCSFCSSVSSSSTHSLTSSSSASSIDGVCFNLQSSSAIMRTSSFAHIFEVLRPPCPSKTPNAAVTPSVLRSSSSQEA